jgi:hypothetical protein
MRRALLALALLAAPLAGCGDDDSGADGPGNARLADVAAGRVPAGEDVRLAGRAYPIGEAGLVLFDDRAGVFVDVEESEATKIDVGEPVRIAGEVNRQDGATAIQITETLEGDDVEGIQSPVVEQALRAAPVGRGEPYVEAVSISGEGNALTGGG